MTLSAILARRTLSVSVKSFPVQTTIGNSRRSGSWRMFSISSKPEMSGNRKSRITQSNLLSRKASKRSRSRCRRRNFNVIVTQQFDDALALDLVVFNDQQAAPARLRVFDTRSKAFFSSPVVAGLMRYEKCAVPEALQALLLDADDLYRDMPRRGILFQMVQHGPAEHIRQENIER